MIDFNTYSNEKEGSVIERAREKQTETERESKTGELVHSDNYI